LENWRILRLATSQSSQIGVGLEFRVVAKFDLKESALVKSRQLEGIRPLGSLREGLTKIAGRDLPLEIWLNAITASFFGLKCDPIHIRNGLNGVFLPVTFSGGIQTLKEAEAYFAAGVDRIAVNTAGLKNPSFFGSLAREFGSQAVVASIEARNLGGEYFAFGEAGRWNSGQSVSDWIRRLSDLGVGELIVLSVDNEGTGLGFPSDLLELVLPLAQVPLVLSGGFGNAKQVKDVGPGLRGGGVALSRMTHLDFTEFESLFTKDSE